ncbi:hypothetical protein IMX26_04890 [Clostridium sp. 'deep sea']|uniref:hypothetical protein n=1 Tax=Clostridium sp. 'deep sea' TaxID=2779445 RepID=UPI0018967C01|nr:hypothetical protein [Clostridium sp. 'deep sea']QOR36152.1 hypothetical protein IMX26_04890 [Clostridium sp. 'deep sea']
MNIIFNILNWLVSPQRKGYPLTKPIYTILQIPLFLLILNLIKKHPIQLKEVIFFSCVSVVLMIIYAIANWDDQRKNKYKS